MSIIQNIPCPACQELGHDSTGDHLMVFSDGAKYCKRKHFHKSGTAFYLPPESGVDPIKEAGITGKIKYSADQFRELEKSGKLDNPVVRKTALDGMKSKIAYSVMTEQEREALKNEWKLDIKHFNTLKIKNLVSRGINGKYCKLYNVRVGFDDNDKVARHYYPRYYNGELLGAKCRTLPKDFRYGHLGRMFPGEDCNLFGMNTLQAVLDSGRRMDTLLIVGGELDALAAQQMLTESQVGTKWEGVYYHVWSPANGESAFDDIVNNKKAIGKFNKIILGLDADETGKEMNQKISRLFPGKSFILEYPVGCKDANYCLMDDRAKEFVEAWWNPVDPHLGSKVKSVDKLRGRLKAGLPEYGKSWPWPGMNRLTLAMRKHILYVIGAGAGVGKTEFLRTITKHLIDVHGESVGIISTEDPIIKVARSYIGKWINKKIELPATNDKDDPQYRELLDYTEQDANAAIDMVADTGKLFIADMEGDYSIDAVLEQIEEFYLQGVDNILVDNLTGIKLKSGNKVEAIDEAVKQIGTYKDTKPVSIFLVSHLTRPQAPRTPHEEGGDVLLSDFRGSGAIGFWASYAIGIQRNTKAETQSERVVTKYIIVKDRDQGIFTGESIYVVGNERTGELREHGTSTNSSNDVGDSNNSSDSNSVQKSEVEQKAFKPYLVKDNDEF